MIGPFLKALSAGKADEAAALTDNPEAAREAITALFKGLPAGSLTYEGMPSTDPNPATVPVTATLKVMVPLSWNMSVPVTKVSDDKWVVKWSPTVLHPKLQAGQTIAVLGEQGETGEAAVLDDAGKPLAVWEGSTTKPTGPQIAAPVMKALLDGSSGGSSGSGDKRYVAIVDSAGKDVELLYGEKPTHSSADAVKSTLNAKITAAAQSAVDKSSQPSIIVAIKPSTGGILAVANNSSAGATDAFSGLFAPGSAFKIASVAAAIQQGLNVDSPVECPASANISGRTLKNAGFDVPNANLRTAFARSCNTTFGKIASQLPADGLSKAASQFGLNADFEIPGLRTELGKVEPSGNAVQRVEDSIGQGRVVASPLGMAVVAATVASGKAVTPKLRADVQTNVVTGYQPPSGAVLSQIKSMMGAVVTSGTATSLSSFKGTYGKTGTAETESQGTNANSWFVGFRGDVAFAVLVEDGKTSTPALTVTANFLRGF
ncbi:penicillin-binding protein [Kibdelosporangium philippinense]|uniref:Penicillin-binding protein n=1 Tax=Kibdelosporangium philippinense TaxID=211113 RepID=A0ABS8ZIQ9_9PSEU|nr:penicillin-binding protein [Kibdelosporangium philippinense]